MGLRPLRQHYDHVLPLARAGDVGELVEVWDRHRARFLEQLGRLDDEQWQTTSRCDAWTVRDVVLHLITVDSFWVITLGQAQLGTATRFLESFDPSGTPETLIDSMRVEPDRWVLERFAEGSDALRSVVHAFDAGGWGAIAESPMGHVPAHLALAHGYWDSWLHERDVLVPLGLAPEPEPDELLVALDYSLLAAGVQGGLVDDPGAIGEGPSEPIDELLAPREVPGVVLRVEVGGPSEGVRIERVPPSGGEAAISALSVVEGFTGRCALADDGGLPAPLLAQVSRAQHIL